MLSDRGMSKPGLKQADGVGAQCSIKQPGEEGATQQNEDQTPLMSGLIWPATPTMDSEPEKGSEHNIAGHASHHRQNVHNIKTKQLRQSKNAAVHNDLLVSYSTEGNVIALCFVIKSVCLRLLQPLHPKTKLHFLGLLDKAISSPSAPFIESMFSFAFSDISPFVDEVHRWLNSSFSISF